MWTSVNPVGQFQLSSPPSKFSTCGDQWYITFSWFSIRISMTMFWNLISMMAATVSSWGRSRVGPNTTPRFATVIKFCLWLLATLVGRKRNGTNERNSVWVDSWPPVPFPSSDASSGRSQIWGHVRMPLESEDRLFYSYFHLPKVQKSPVFGLFCYFRIRHSLQFPFCLKQPTNQTTNQSSLPSKMWTFAHLNPYSANPGNC